MSSDFVLSITTKDTPKQKNPIHVVMWEGTDGTQELLERISHLEKAIHKLTERQSSIFFPTALYPTPCGIEVKSRSNSFTNEFDLNVFRTISKVSGSDAGEAVRPEEEEQEQEQEEEEVDIDEIVNSMKEMDMEEADRLEEDEDEDEGEEDEEKDEDEGEGDADRLEEEKQGELVESKEGEQEEEEQEEAEAKEEEQEEAEAKEEQEQEQEEELQEAEEFKEFVWKGQTYYKDSENLVYQLDTDGDLIDTPIGIWKEETQKLVKYKAV
jgi:hypothetical protein